MKKREEKEKTMTITFWVIKLKINKRTKKSIPRNSKNMQ
jgi:hypothetical protein